jgi:hypothetical protein
MTKYRCRAAMLAVFALTFTLAALTHAAPVLVLQPAAGVDLDSLVPGQTFQVDVVITGIAGETFAVGGGGTLSVSPPLLALTGATVELSAGDVLTDASVLFELLFQALAPGAGAFGIQGSFVETDLARYDNLSTGTLAFTVLEDVNGVSEPPTLALLAMALVLLSSWGRLRPARSVDQPRR